MGYSRNLSWLLETGSNCIINHRRCNDTNTKKSLHSVVSKRCSHQPEASNDEDDWTDVLRERKKRSQYAANDKDSETDDDAFHIKDYTLSVSMVHQRLLKKLDRRSRNVGGVLFITPRLRRASASSFLRSQSSASS